MRHVIGDTSLVLLGLGAMLLGAPVAARSQEGYDDRSPDTSIVDASTSIVDAGERTLDLLNQTQKPAGPAPTPRHTGVRALIKDLGSDVTHLPSRQNLYWVALGGGLALAAHPADDNVN